MLRLCGTKVYDLIVEDRDLLEKAAYSVGRTRKWRGGFGKLHSEGV